MLLSSWYPSRIDPFNGDFVQRHALAISQLNKVSVIHVEGDATINKWELEINQINENLREYRYYFPKSRIPLINFFYKTIGLQKGKNLIGKTDLIHVNVVHYHFIWLLFQSIPFIITEHATQYHRFQSLKNAWLKKLVFRPIFKNAKWVLPVSRNLANKLEEHFGKLSIQIIPNVIDINLFYPTKNTNPTFTFLHISNLSVAKNINGILEAIKLLKQKGLPFLFQIGGNGDTSYIEEFTKTNRLEDIIQILPSLSHSEVAEYMRSADCFVLFSDFENQPCVLAEALASGIPFISTEVGGVKEFIPDEGTWLVEKGDIQQLADTMEKLVNKRPQIDKDNLANYAKETFAANYISQKINKIYNDCLDGTKSK
jgi:glycosyltransferase involved in cell wall biosynthesis